MAAKKSYSEQLKDPRWQRKRLEILEARGWECESCGSSTETLHVHHKCYIRGRSPWEYDDAELAVLCATCHVEEQEEMEAVGRLIARLGPCSLRELRGVVAAMVAEESGSCSLRVEDYQEAESKHEFLLGFLSRAAPKLTGRQRNNCAATLPIDNLLEFPYLAVGTNADGAVKLYPCNVQHEVWG